MELNANNLKECNLDPNLAALFPKSHQLYKCYKFTRDEIRCMIFKTSSIFEVNGRKFFWLLGPTTHLMNTLQWNIARKAPEHVFKEPHFTLRRDEFVGFHILDEDTMEAMIAKESEVSPHELISGYREIKEIGKFTETYAYMKLDNILPGGVTLVSHLQYMVEAVINKTEEYRLINEILNK